MADILVINPNSTRSMTTAIAAGLGVATIHARRRIECIDLPESPPGIEVDADVEAAIPHILEAVATRQADAYVLACFSDPGIGQIRSTTGKLVVGIAEAAYLAAINQGTRFGIVSLGPSSIGRHRRYLLQLGLIDRLAGDRSIDMTVTQLMANDAVEPVSRIANALRHDDGADVIVLGCAGLGSYRQAIEEVTGIPVVDPVLAGVARACALLDQHQEEKRS